MSLHSAPKQSELVKTCPFVSNLSLPAEQAWRSLKVFHAYQLVLSLAFFTLFASHTGPAMFGQSNPSLFYSVSLTYFTITLFSTVFIRKPYIPYARQVQLKIITDIAFLTLIMHASGGITSGLGILLAVTVAAGGLLAGGLCTLFFAAIATFAVLGEQIIADTLHSFAKTAYTYAGVLSASFFTIALLAMVLAKRVEKSQRVAEQQGRDISSLQQLNSYIIKQLPSGVIVIDQHNNISDANAAASILIGQPLIIGSSLLSSSEAYWQLFNRWRRNPLENIAIFSATPNTPRIRLRFSQLTHLTDKAYVIFLEDLSVIDQQVQQGKLASLGRLTASIAHEIRNPLGAISHAGELLAESHQLNQEDQHLLNIIHKHSARVNRIVKNIMDLSRQQESLIEPINLHTWLKDFENDFIEEFGLSASPLQFETDSGAGEINFDKNHLKQIIDNLCSNALKYGQQQLQPIRINIKAGRTALNNAMYISISDHGKGIDDKLAQQIFEPFFTTSSSGTGLGLYISSQLAQLNHATLSYTTNNDGGSCFTLLFTQPNP